MSVAVIRIKESFILILVPVSFSFPSFSKLFLIKGARNDNRVFCLKQILEKYTLVSMPVKKFYRAVAMQLDFRILRQDSFLLDAGMYPHTTAV